MFVKEFRIVLLAADFELITSNGIKWILSVLEGLVKILKLAQDFSLADGCGAVNSKFIQVAISVGQPRQQ